MTLSAEASPHGQPRVALYILSRDRVELCREAMVSAVAQSYSNLQLVLSDNSVTEDVMGMMHQEFPLVHVVRRQPQLTAIDHFNAILSEVDADLLVMFHDDDVFSPGYVESMVALALNNPDISAVACNANFIYGHAVSTEKVMGSFRGQKILHSAVELLAPYLCFGMNDPAPYPGYMYRTAKIRGLVMDSSMGGKHCDVSFLCQVCQRGPVLWTADCHFYYRLHASNDSGKEAVADRLSLVRYIQSSVGLHRRSSALMDYRFMYWRRWLKQSPVHTRSGARTAVVKSFVWVWGLRLACTRLRFWARSWRALVRASKR